MKRSLPWISVIITFVLCANIAFGEDINSKLLADIEDYIKAGEFPPPEQGKLIIDRLEKNPAGIVGALIERAKADGASEKAVSVYVWSIGWTRDVNAVGELIKIANVSKSPKVKGNVFEALGRIGGQKAGDYLLARAKEASDTDPSGMDMDAMVKFDILNCLAEMKYAPALEEMVGLLKKDYKKYYWQQIFCFGKMGDKAVPFLLQHINDGDKNTRFAATALLGQTLLAEEAVKPLTERYWREEDSEVKTVILSSLERIISDCNEMEIFFKKVVAKEQDKDAKRFAEETIDGLSEYKAKIKEEKAKKKDNKELYQKEYGSLYKSGGHEGDIDVLGIYSSFKDEQSLKKLRERILLRNSDECFYDYDKVNLVIMFNRLITKNE